MNEGTTGRIIYRFEVVTSPLGDSDTKTSYAMTPDRDHTTFIEFAMEHVTCPGYDASAGGTDGYWKFTYLTGPESNPQLVSKRLSADAPLKRCLDTDAISSNGILYQSQVCHGVRCTPPIRHGPRLDRRDVYDLPPGADSFAATVSSLRQKSIGGTTFYEIIDSNGASSMLADAFYKDSLEEWNIDRKVVICGRVHNPERYGFQEYWAYYNKNPDGHYYRYAPSPYESLKGFSQDKLNELAGVTSSPRVTSNGVTVYKFTTDTAVGAESITVEPTTNFLMTPCYEGVCTRDTAYYADADALGRSIPGSPSAPRTFPTWGDQFDHNGATRWSTPMRACLSYTGRQLPDDVDTFHPQTQESRVDGNMRRGLVQGLYIEHSNPDSVPDSVSVGLESSPLALAATDKSEWYDRRFTRDGPMHHHHAAHLAAHAAVWTVTINVWNAENPCNKIGEDPEPECDGEGAQQGEVPNSPATGGPVITGTSEIGERLTADTSGVGVADGLDDVSYDYQWIRDGNDVDGATGATYVVLPDDSNTQLEVRINFTDDRGHEESLTSRYVYVPPPELVYGGLSGPDRHDGSTSFEVELLFSVEPDLQASKVRQYVVDVTAGRISRAVQKTPGNNIAWILTVVPDGNDDVVLSVPPTTDCGVDSAVCTRQGGKMVNHASLTVSGPEDAVPPGPPTNLAASVDSDGHIALNWVAPEGPVTGYQILRRLPKHGQHELIRYVKNTRSMATNYLDDNTASDTRYVYRVKAWNGDQLGPQSNYVKLDK